MSQFKKVIEIIKNIVLFFKNRYQIFYYPWNNAVIFFN